MDTNLSQLAKLLTTKMSHDLAGPIGGISNGVEFLSESLPADDGAQQSLSLLKLGSEEGAAKLQMFRQAYGIINQAGGTTEISFLKDLVYNYLKNTKIEVVWNAGEINEISNSTKQVLLNLLMVVNSALITGGSIKINFDGSSNLSISAEGSQIKFTEETENIFSGEIDIEDITPQSVQIYFTFLLINDLGVKMVHEVAETTLSIKVSNLG